MKESTPLSMFKRVDFTSKRREISQNTTALFPEYFAGLPENILEELFFDRCKLAGKDSRKYLYGSPFHGEQRLLYQGESDIYELTTMSKIERPVWSTRINEITSLLKSGGSVLFTPEDVEAARQVNILTADVGGILGLLNSIVAKDKLNGIILIPNQAKNTNLSF